MARKFARQPAEKPLSRVIARYSFQGELEPRMNQEDTHQSYALAEKLLSEQNFAAAVIVGAIAAVLAAAIYGITTATWGYSYGFAAAGIGLVVGISMQYLGRGIEIRFALLAAVYTIAGCVLGSVFRALIQQARDNGVSPTKVFLDNELAVIAGWSVSYLSWIDLVFWLVGVWFAVFLAKRPLSRAESLAIRTHELKT